MRETINNTIKMKKMTFAISAEATAMPVKPNTPAMIAIIKNVSTQLNMKILH